MAAYPSYSTGLGSSRTPENTYRDDVSSSGIQHSRLMRSKQYQIFDVTHPGLTGQQFNDLMVTYAAGPRDTFTGFTWHTSSPSVTYSVKFLGPPETTVSYGNNRFDVRVQLRGWPV